jgi:hypothetical protein
MAALSKPIRELYAAHGAFLSYPSRPATAMQFS